MKQKLGSILFLFFTLLSYSQEEKFLDGTIITTDLDTLNVKIKVFNDSESLLKIRYLNKKGKIKRIPIDNVQSYKRGNDFYKRITISKSYKLLSKQINSGPNFNLYSRKEGNGQGMSYIPHSPSIPFMKVANSRMSFFLENKYGIAIELSSHSKKKFKKQISNFLLQYPSIIEKINNGELTEINQIVNECNKLD
jgi:hypothetical protein